MLGQDLVVIIKDYERKDFIVCKVASGGRYTLQCGHRVSKHVVLQECFLMLVFGSAVLMQTKIHTSICQCALYYVIIRRIRMIVV